MPRTTAVPKPIREPFATPEGASWPMGGHVPHPPSDCPYKFELHNIWWSDAVLCRKCQQRGLCPPAMKWNKQIKADIKAMRDSRPKRDEEEKTDATND